MLAGDAGQIAAERAERSSMQAAAPFPPANSSPLPLTPRYKSLAAFHHAFIGVKLMPNQQNRWHHACAHVSKLGLGEPHHIPLFKTSLV